MSTNSKIIVFVLFIFVYVLWTSLQYILLTRLARDAISKRGSILVSLIFSAAFYIGFALYIWFLTGFIGLEFLSLLLAAQLLSIILSSVSWMIIGDQTINSHAGLFIEGTLLAIRYPWTRWIDITIGLMISVGFPITVGWVYFNNTVPSDKNTIQIFKVTIVFLLLMGLIMALKNGILALSSATVVEQSRDHLLVGQLGSFISLGLSLSMILWAFAAGTPIVPTGALGPLNVSWNVVGILIAFLLIAYIGPYLVGVQRSKNLRRSFDHETEEVLQTIVETLKLPRSPSARGEVLRKLRRRIDAQVADVRSKYAIFAIGGVVENLQSDAAVPDAVLQLKAAYDQAHLQDPCVRYVQTLDELDGKIKELEAAVAEPSFHGSLDGAGDVFKDELDQLRETAKIKERPRMAVWVVAGLSALASPIVGELGKLIAKRVADAAGIKLGALIYLTAHWT